MIETDKFPAGITFHGLGLAIASVVVWPPALIAGSWSRSANSAIASTEATCVTTAASHPAATATSIRWSLISSVRACTLDKRQLLLVFMIPPLSYRNMADLAAGVTASSTSTSATYAESRTVSLYMTKALAVIALLC